MNNIVASKSKKKNSPPSPPLKHFENGERPPTPLENRTTTAILEKTITSTSLHRDGGAAIEKQSETIEKRPKSNKTKIYVHVIMATLIFLTIICLLITVITTTTTLTSISLIGWLSLVISVVLLMTLTYYVKLQYSDWLYVAMATLPRDLRALYHYIKLLIFVKRMQRGNMTLMKIFEKNVEKWPNKIAFHCDDQKWTFSEIDIYSKKVALVFRHAGYKKGQKIALYMENRPEYVAIWLGLAKLGIITPLVNTNLRHHQLIHSLTVTECDAVIFGSGELTDAISQILDKLAEVQPQNNNKMQFYQLKSTDGGEKSQQNDIFQQLDDLMLSNCQSLTEEDEKKEEIVTNIDDHLLYIYTSGTTGLPKAAVITSQRYLFIASAMYYLCQFSATDIFYSPLPLYHTAGGCMTVGQVLIFGATMVTRRKFSARHYFADCQKYRCTAAQYIGEMCRYLLSTAAQSTDTAHNLRLIYGNGLRPQIWQHFCQRFNIPSVKEFYGATEGNANIVNTDNTVGAVGFLSRIIPKVYPISIIKVNDEGQPIRDARSGLCQPCAADEVGVFIGRIFANNPARAYLGYVDRKASSKKVIYDVFQHGDCAFNSGDLMTADRFGYLYFKDRTGDTYRWKGENVSTLEIEAVLSNLLNYKDVIVYGVAIANLEGRAGMAAILDDAVNQPPVNVNDVEFLTGVKKLLPTYARPIFIRLLSKLDLTGTFKLKKTDLQNDSFDPRRCHPDKLFYFDSCQSEYAPVNEEIYEKILNGEVRL